MSQTIQYNDFPKRFPHCFNSGCKQSNECLHYQINEITPEKLSTVTCINPKRLNTLKGQDCPFFISCRPQLYGKGFSHLFDHIAYPVAMHIKEKMITAFGRTNYYRYYRKERLFSPKDQALVKKFFQEAQVAEEPRFDEYIDFFDLG